MKKDQRKQTKKQSPYQKTNWDTIWREMERIRNFKGSETGSLSAFIAADRHRH